MQWRKHDDLDPVSMADDGLFIALCAAPAFGQFIIEGGTSLSSAVAYNGSTWVDDLDEFTGSDLYTGSAHAVNSNGASSAAHTFRLCPDAITSEGECKVNVASGFGNAYVRLNAWFQVPVPTTVRLVGAIYNPNSGNANNYIQTPGGTFTSAGSQTTT